jgi:hypothetical protein
MISTSTRTSDRLLGDLLDAEARARGGVADRLAVDPIGVLGIDTLP